MDLDKPIVGAGLGRTRTLARQALGRVAIVVWATGLGGMLLAGCGGGGGGTSKSPTTTPPVADLHQVASSLPDDAVEVSTAPSFQIHFDADLVTDGLSAFVQLEDPQGTVPVDVEAKAHVLTIKPRQSLKTRTQYILTIKAGLKGTNGAILRSEVVRHFRTMLLAGINKVVQPANNALINYAGQHTFRIADVTADGLPDIVQIGGDAELRNEGNSFAVNVFAQNPDHSFIQIQKLLIHEQQDVYRNSMGEIEIIDLDHDDIPEIVISIQRNLPGVNGLMILKQAADGLYAVSDFIATDFAYLLRTGDFNLDGKQDLLGVGQGLALTDGPDRCGMVSVLSSAAGARIQSSTVLPCGAHEALLGRLCTEEELNLVLLRSSYASPSQSFQSRLSIFRLDTEGHPTLDDSLMTAATPVCAGMFDCSNMMLIDVNGDGIQDLLTAASVTQSESTMVVYTRTENGPFAEFVRQGFGNRVFALKASDLDRDGLDDLLAVVQNLGSYVGAAFTRSGPRFDFSSLIPVEAFDTMNDSTVGVADLDGNGLPDVVLDSYNTGLSVFFQTSL